MQDGLRAGATGSVTSVMGEESGSSHRRVVSLARVVAPAGMRQLGLGRAGRAVPLSLGVRGVKRISVKE